jgi:hypothetical protein
VEKMRFSLKTSKWTYGYEIGHMVRSIIDRGRTRIFSVGGRNFFVCLRLPKGEEDFKIP